MFEPQRSKLRLLPICAEVELPLSPGAVLAAGFANDFVVDALGLPVAQLGSLSGVSLLCD